MKTNRSNTNFFNFRLFLEGLKRLRVIDLSMHESRHERRENFLSFGKSRSRYRCKRSSVEGLFE